MTKAQKMIDDARKVEQAWEAFKSACQSISPLRIFIDEPHGGTVDMSNDPVLEFRTQYIPEGDVE